LVAVKRGAVGKERGVARKTVERVEEEERAGADKEVGEGQRV